MIYAIDLFFGNHRRQLVIFIMFRYNFRSKYQSKIVMYVTVVQVQTYPSLMEIAITHH